MSTPDTDPERDLEHRYETDLTQLQDAECSSCLGTGMVCAVGAEEWATCVDCAGSGSRGSSTVARTSTVVGERITQRVTRVAPAQICAIVGPELDPVGSGGGGAARLSPIASLALLALDHLEAERAFRRSEVRALSVGRAASGYDRSLVVVIQSEINLRKACGASSPDGSSLAELHYSDLMEIIGSSSSIDVPAVPSERRDLVAASSHPSTIQSARDLGRWARVSAWARAALSRIRRGWEPR